MAHKPNSTTKSEPTRSQPKFRDRIAKVLGKMQKPDAITNDYDGDVKIPNPSPSRTRSQPTTGRSSSMPKSSRSHVLPLRHRPSKIEKMGSIGSVMGVPEKERKLGEGDRAVVASGGHVPVTDMPTSVQLGLRGALRMGGGKETEPLMPASPSREAVLTSHPVAVKESNSLDGEVETPAEEVKGEKKNMIVKGK